ncbi:MAG: tRNA pseudouridine(38-40) synthase TruA [Planctomycetaceae bacterium]|nr:tRNA pseudouridine(38-40) synthase TruA [Planctomycetaceae bacterium]
MRNIRLILAYDGGDFVGWQVQPNGRSVQAVVEQAIQKLTGETVRVMAAGRTDSGVHALGQVINFPLAHSIPCDRIRRGLQNFLPSDVVVVNADEVPPEFHATYSAVKKRYRYVIHQSPVRSPFLERYVWSRSDDLDIDRMQQAADCLLGKQDFRCFESHFPNKATSVRTVLEAKLFRAGGWAVWNPCSLNNAKDQVETKGPFLCFEIVADGFLYNMVRAIMGTLFKVGRGKWSPGDVRKIIDQQDRALAGETAPAQGLYLVSVDYEEAINRNASDDRV